MIDPGKIEGIFRNLDTYLEHLRTLARMERREVLDDFAKSGSLRYYLQVAVECCLNVANHVIAALGLRAPRDYADAFSVLGEADIVPRDFVPTLKQMARLRNRLVHLYWEVEDEVLYGIAREELADFDRFKACILALVPPPQEAGETDELCDP